MTEPLLRPLERMRKFASLLDWNGLQLFGASWGDTRIYLYQTPDDKFNLQINEAPDGQVEEHKATIKACRYGIVHIEWVPFTLFDDAVALQNEARRVYPLLSRSKWKSKAWRINRLQEPGVILRRTRKKIRGRRRRAPNRSMQRTG